MSDIQVISKMSVKTMGCNPRKVAGMDDNKDGKPVTLPLCVIYGIASGLKHGEDKVNGGVWTALTGDFEGKNLQTGETFRSGKLFLPSGIQEIVEGPIKKAEDENGSCAIKFAFEISAVKASNPIGYSYQAKPLTKPTEGDQLSELRAIAAPSDKQLEAPKQDDEKDTKKKK